MVPADPERTGRRRSECRTRCRRMPCRPHSGQLEDNVVGVPIIVLILIYMSIDHMERRMVEWRMTTLHALVSERFPGPHERGQVAVFDALGLIDAGLFRQAAIRSFIVRQAQRQDVI
jgi:hypothetical protein